MCCGQNRAQLTGSPPARPTPSFRRNPPVSVPLAIPRLSASPAVTGSSLQGGGAPETPLEHSSPPVYPERTSVPLQYKEQSPIRVRGLATGRIYTFSGKEPVQSVDLRDAPALLQTSHFRRP